MSEYSCEFQVCTGLQWGQDSRPCSQVCAQVLWEYEQAFQSDAQERVLRDTCIFRRSYQDLLTYLFSYDAPAHPHPLPLLSFCGFFLPPQRLSISSFSAFKVRLAHTSHSPQHVKVECASVCGRGERLVILRMPFSTAWVISPPPPQTVQHLQEQNHCLPGMVQKLLYISIHRW